MGQEGERRRESEEGSGRDREERNESRWKGDRIKGGGDERGQQREEKSEEYLTRARIRKC